MKDLCWTLYSPYFIYFSITALTLSGLVLVKCAFDLNFEDVWHKVAEFLWLFANFWWMSADIHDYYNTKEPPVSGS
jgi:hypothetical protein